MSGAAKRRRKWHRGFKMTDEQRKKLLAKKINDGVKIRSRKIKELINKE